MKSVVILWITWILSSYVTIAFERIFKVIFYKKKV